jgi:hypothetical protein
MSMTGLTLADLLASVSAEKKKTPAPNKVGKEPDPEWPRYFGECTNRYANFDKFERRRIRRPVTDQELYGFAMTPKRARGRSFIAVEL